MYIIIEKDYKRFTSKRIFKTFSKYEACIRVEEYASEFVKFKEGNSNKKIYKHTVSGTWKTHPMGYFMVKDKYFNKISVYRKTYNNSIFGGYIIKKVISFEVSETCEKMDFEDYEFYEELQENYMKENKFLKDIPGAAKKRLEITDDINILDD